MIVVDASVWIDVFHGASTPEVERPADARRGITVRKTIDGIIATACIEENLPLLFSDRDFLPYVEHLGLEAA